MFTSILNDKNVNFLFPFSNPGESMASFYNTGFSHTDLGLIHLPNPLPHCCLLVSDSFSLAQEQVNFRYITSYFGLKR